MSPNLQFKGVDWSIHHAACSKVDTAAIAAAIALPFRVRPAGTGFKTLQDCTDAVLSATFACKAAKGRAGCTTGAALTHKECHHVR